MQFNAGREAYEVVAQSLPSQGLVFKRLTTASNWNVEVLVCGGRKPREPGEKPSNNNVNWAKFDVGATGSEHTGQILLFRAERLTDRNYSD